MDPTHPKTAIRSDIMIVDDNPANLRLLEDMLAGEGHEVRSFPRGRLALAAAARTAPDLFLLDVNMPEMNGYEVCERLKSDPRLAHVPVIFLSALTETPDKVRAFQAGAVDYISKPFHFAEVHARVATHLKLHNMTRALQSQNEHLEETVAARTRQLSEANQRLTLLDRSKSEFLSLISHEFRTPLNGILGVSEIVLDEIATHTEATELRDLFEQSRHRILSLLDDALLLTEIDVGADQVSSGTVSLSGAVSLAIDKCVEFAQSRDVTIVAPQTDCAPLVVANERLLVRGLSALLETAVKFSGRNQPVRLSIEVADTIRLSIESLGETIPDSELPKLFDAFSVSEASTPGGHLGLGPAVASRILALFGASVSVRNLDLPGVQFTVFLQCGSSAGSAGNLSHSTR
jgi:DNA-binding response OmpR family regulator